MFTRQSWIPKLHFPIFRSSHEAFLDDEEGFKNRVECNICLFHFCACAEIPTTEVSVEMRYCTVHTNTENNGTGASCGPQMKSLNVYICLKDSLSNHHFITLLYKYQSSWCLTANIRFYKQFSIGLLNPMLHSYQRLEGPLFSYSVFVCMSECLSVTFLLPSWEASCSLASAFFHRCIEPTYICIMHIGYHT